MPNRHDGGFLGLYVALSKDIVTYDPTLAVDMERDLSRIISNVKTRGLSVILKDLPEIAKVLELSLSAGRLEPTHIPFMGGYKTGVPIPRLFKGLWLRLFDVTGCLKQNIDPMYIKFLEQLCCLGKKYEVEPPPSSLYETTKEFYDVDESLPPPSLNWDGGGNTMFVDSNIGLHQRVPWTPNQFDLFGSNDRTHSKLLDTIQRVADIVSTNLGEFYLPTSSRHGRGAVYEDLRGLEKFSVPSWPQRLSNTFPREGFFLPLDRIRDVETGEIPSKLLAVPKTIKGPRLIAKEPAAHMYAQLSMMDWLYSIAPQKIFGVSIDFTNQQISGEMALNASRDGRHGTIDLKSASDRISLWLVERMFRRNTSVLRAMADCRTQYVDLSIDKKLPSLHKLRKFTTQGSALTFPVQSIIFLIICLGVACHIENIRPSERNLRKLGKAIRIFGDDIIIPTDWVEDTIGALELLFLKVNRTKTHYTGYFRESCGVRAYKGVDVTPSYVTALMSGQQRKPAEYIRVIEASNNFAKKWLFNLANAITSTLPKDFVDTIPYGRYADRSIVLHSFSGTAYTDRVKRRWNDRYQREEALIYVQKTKKKKLKLDGSLLLDAFLSTRESRPISPDWAGLNDWYPLSRWESLPVVGKEWVPL